MESNLVKITNDIDISQVEENARRLKPWTERQKKLRLEFLYKSFTPEQIKDIEQETSEICYDDSFFENTYLDYCNPDSLLIKVALSEYLLKNAKENNSKNN
tara:strand:- start:489 stop:791 length:303 start_codon:yes stop_codon:yes gene_type:complete